MRCWALIEGWNVKIWRNLHILLFLTAFSGGAAWFGSTSHLKKKFYKSPLGMYHIQYSKEALIIFIRILGFCLSAYLSLTCISKFEQLKTFTQVLQVLCSNIFQISLAEFQTGRNCQNPLTWGEMCYYHWMSLQNRPKLASGHVFGLDQVFMCLWKILSLLFRKVECEIKQKNIVWKEAFLLLPVFLFW
jgi:hypothetical protein